jgi:hypothetical protein
MDSVSDDPVVQFLKRRYAGAIRCGDHRTATRLRAELDRLMNGLWGQIWSAHRP